MAVRNLGKTADPVEIDTEAAAIKNTKCAEAESLTLEDLETIKDSRLSADETTLWENLGSAQVGLKKYAEAERSFKRVLEIQASSGSPKPEVQAFANSGLGRGLGAHPQSAGGSQSL